MLVPRIYLENKMLNFEPACQWGERIVACSSFSFEVWMLPAGVPPIVDSSPSELGENLS